VWREGDTVLRREVRNDGWAWLELEVRVVRDDDDLLATYIPPGPEPHPWSARRSWQGHGVLMLQRPGEAHAIWVFWQGPHREHHGWYVNFQEPFRRTERGYDTQDLELDIWIPAGGGWAWKDADVLEHRIAEGRFTREQVDATWLEGRRVAAELDAGRRWWDPRWALWEPDPEWDARHAGDG